MSSIRRRLNAVPVSKPSVMTFMDKVLAGQAIADDIHSYIARWHEADSGSLEAELQLHDYLGMSWDEYRLWGEHPESIRFVLAARRAGVPVAEVLVQAKVVGAAARSFESSEAERVLQWLIDRGRVSASVRNV